MRPNPILRRENRIRTIHSSLAIEQNTFTLDQVTNVINGKRILGPPFVAFMLGMIRSTLQEISETHNRTNVVINVGVNVVTNEEKIIALLRQEGKA